MTSCTCSATSTTNHGGGGGLPLVIASHPIGTGGQSLWLQSCCFYKYTCTQQGRPASRKRRGLMAECAQLSLSLCGFRVAVSTNIHVHSKGDQLPGREEV